MSVIFVHCSSTSECVLSYYAALLPRRGPHIASHSVCLSVCPSVCPSVPLSSVTSPHLANYNDTHVLCGTRRGPHIVRPSRPHKLVLFAYMNINWRKLSDTSITVYPLMTSRVVQIIGEGYPEEIWRKSPSKGVIKLKATYKVVRVKNSLN